MLRQKIVYYLTFASIFLIPLSGIFPGPNIWYVQMIFLIGFLSAGVGLSLFEFNPWLCGLNLTATYSTLVTANQGLRSLFFLFIFNLSSCASMQISKLDKQKRIYLIEGIVLLFAIQFLWVGLQFFNRDFIFDLGTNVNLDDTVAFSGSHNQMGLFFAITSPLVLSISPLLLILTVFAVCLSKTTSAYLGMAIGCSVYSWWTNKRNLLFIFIILTISSLIYFTKFEHNFYAPMQERIKLIKHSIHEVFTGIALAKYDNGRLQPIQTRKFEGFGLGNFIAISPHTQWRFMDVHPLYKGDSGNNPQHRYEHMHNDYMEIFYEMGVVGFIFTIGLVLSFFWEFIKSKKSLILVISFCCILAQMVTALGIYTIYTAISGMLLIIFYGIFSAEIREQIELNNVKKIS